MPTSSAAEANERKIDNENSLKRNKKGIKEIIKNKSKNENNVKQ